MLLIAVVNSKGGTGKTMLTSALVVRAVQAKLRVGIVDLELGQASMTRWWTTRGCPDNPELLTGSDFASEAVEGLEATRRWDVIFFDGIPGAMEKTEDAIQTADFVVIPLKPGDLNIAASEPTIAACMAHGTEYMIVVNEALRFNDRQASDTLEALKGLHQPVYDKFILQRISHRTASDVGKSGPELDNGKDAAAVSEIDALFNEVMVRAERAKKAKSKKRKSKVSS
jgi:cellulose biosynthesis protein BcsQ